MSSPASVSTARHTSLMNVDDVSTPQVSLVALLAPSRTGTATGTAEHQQNVRTGCTAQNNASVTTTIGSAALSTSMMSVEGVLAPATASGSGEITAGDTPLDEVRADDSSKSKSKRISKAAIEALFEYFAKMKWPRNKNLPKQNGDSTLDKIIQTYGLQRRQASYQLRKWKGMTYEHTQVELVVRPEEIEKSISECMSTKTDEFVRSILDDIAEGREVSGSNDATVLHQSIHNHVPGHLSAVKFIRDNTSHECNSLLADFCDSLTKLAGEIFPKGRQS